MLAPMTVPPPRRPLCPTCLRPQSSCICAWITPLVIAADLLILQHPLEVGNAKGSARLLHLCIAGSQLLVGESFDGAALSALLYADGRRPLLLYPDDAVTTPPSNDGAPAAPLAVAGRSAGFTASSTIATAAAAAGCATAAAAESVIAPGAAAAATATAANAAAAVAAADAGVRLVVLDGTWRKSRKMLHLNPVLAALPRLALRQMPPSHYHIRKAHRPDQLSSFEAAAYALAGVPAAGAARAPALDADGLQALLRAFDGFVAQQAAYVETSQTPAG